MGGKAHGGRRVSQQEAGRIFFNIDRMLEHNQLFLCGSYRRDKPDCGDLDIVIIPRNPDLFDRFCVDNFGMQKNGKNPMRNGLIGDVQVEFYVATPENLGTFLQMWTGSMQTNIKLRKLAREKGYSLSQYGFKCLKTNKLHKCATEIAVYEFLGIGYVSPTDR